MPKKMAGLPTIANSPMPPHELCATKCYPADAAYLHPITNEATRFNHPTCATYPHLVNKEYKWYQKCEISSQLEYPPNLDLTIPFDATLFLQDIYQIRTVQHYLRWIAHNEHMFLRSKNRISNCAWKAFIWTEQDLTDDLLEYHRGAIEEYCQTKDRSLTFTDRQMLTVAKEALRIRDQWRDISLMRWMEKLGLRMARDTS